MVDLSEITPFEAETWTTLSFRHGPCAGGRPLGQQHPKPETLNDGGKKKDPRAIAIGLVA